MVADLGQTMPVWFPAPVFDDPDSMPISEHLRDRLIAWNKAYKASVDDDGSLRNDAEREQHDSRGRALAAELAAELGEDYEVHLFVLGYEGHEPSTGWVRV